MNCRADNLLGSFIAVTGLYEVLISSLLTHSICEEIAPIPIVGRVITGQRCTLRPLDGYPHYIHTISTLMACVQAPIIYSCGCPAILRRNRCLSGESFNDSRRLNSQNSVSRQGQHRGLNKRHLSNLFLITVLSMQLQLQQHWLYQGISNTPCANTPRGRNYGHRFSEQRLNELHPQGNNFTLQFTASTPVRIRHNP